MPSSRPLPLLLLFILFLVSSAAPVIGCGQHCHKPRRTHHKGKTPKGPPVTMPPITVPPVFPYPPPPPASDTCPIDTLKLGACVDLLGGLIHIGLGNPVMDECCPVLQGLAELEAAVCLCTTLRLKLLNLNIFVPIALQLLLTCGKSPPPGFTCSL